MLKSYKLFNRVFRFLIWFRPFFCLSSLFIASSFCSYAQASPLATKRLSNGPYAACARGRCSLLELLIIDEPSNVFSSLPRSNFCSLLHWQIAKKRFFDHLCIFAFLAALNYSNDCKLDGVASGRKLEQRRNVCDGGNKQQQRRRRCRRRRWRQQTNVDWTASLSASLHPMWSRRQPQIAARRRAHHRHSGEN